MRVVGALFGTNLHLVIAGLDPAIHADFSAREPVLLLSRNCLVDCRVKPGNGRWRGCKSCKTGSQLSPAHIDTPAPVPTLNAVPRGALVGLRKTL